MTWDKPDMLVSPTGARLSLRSALPPGGPKALVLVNHGMAEHGERYGRFAEFLAANGYGVFAHDHRGHGHTKAPQAPLGSFGPAGALDLVLEDIEAVHAEILQRFPDRHIIVFGHSMGAILALNHVAATRLELGGAAIWNSTFHTSPLYHVGRMLILAERMFKGSDVPSTLAQKLTFEAWNKEFAPNRTAHDWLSRDKAEVDKYAADPLCGFPCTTGLWLDVMEAVKRGAASNALAHCSRALPFHLAGGAADPSSEKGSSITRLGRRLRKEGFNDVTAIIHPETRHECLNETNRDEVMGGFLAWLDARFQ